MTLMFAATNYIVIIILKLKKNMESTPMPYRQFLIILSYN